MVLTAWLVAWIGLSWAAVQDDALIHLRYADNFYQTGHISYDGIHPDYGASSLAYVVLLGTFRAFTDSVDLPRSVSSVAHLSLFAGLGWLITFRLPKEAVLARLLGVALLLFMVSPSSVRWLDDGMETGIGLCIVTLLCCLTFRQARHSSMTSARYAGLALVGLFAVLLRTELALLCGISFAILSLQYLVQNGKPVAGSSGPRYWIALLKAGSPICLGGVVALAIIVWRMHVLLPDTAFAKSHGLTAWKGVLSSTPVILLGGMSFGVGLFLFWCLSLVLVIRGGRGTLSTTFANSVFPITILLALLRGQEIQGARYLAWTFFFSIVWNLLTLGFPPSLSIHAPPIHTVTPLKVQQDPTGALLIYTLIALFFLAQPIEVTSMYRVLRRRAVTLSQFKRQHLQTLAGKLGTAFDIGYIGYFSQARICDLAGLVNGREAARGTNDTRAAKCAARHPDFLFVNRSQIGLMQAHMSLEGWQVCGHYSFTNIKTPDTHYLLLPKPTADSLCHAISGTAPEPLTRLLAAPAF
jgi:hypothetical protein